MVEMFIDPHRHAQPVWNLETLLKHWEVCVQARTGFNSAPNAFASSDHRAQTRALENRAKRLSGRALETTRGAGYFL